MSSEHDMSIDHALALWSEEHYHVAISAAQAIGRLDAEGLEDPMDALAFLSEANGYGDLIRWDVGGREERLTDHGLEALHQILNQDKAFHEEWRERDHPEDVQSQERRLSIIESALRTAEDQR